MLTNRFKLFIFVFPLSLLYSTAFAGHIVDNNKFDDDIIVPMPCNESMIFRKVYTGSRARASRSFVDQNSTKKICTVQGSFEDSSGYYYLLSKYELTEYQYRILTESKCPTYKKTLNAPAILHSKEEFSHAALVYSSFLQKTDKAPHQQGIKAIVSLPRECDWSFALRGGLKVTEKDLSGISPYPAYKLKNIEDFAWAYGPNSANNKIQLVGRLKPNILGLYDLLGNAQEIMSDSTNGANVTVRGGGIYTPKESFNNEIRYDKPVFSSNGEIMKSKETGTRFELIVPVHISLKDVAKKEALEKLKNQEESRLEERISSNFNNNKAIEHTSQEKTIEELRKKCLSNDISSCELVIEHYRKNLEEKSFDYGALKYFEKACELKNGKGCSRLGYLYAQGQGVKQDYRKAKEYYEKACELKDGEGCSGLANMYNQGRGVKPDLATEYWEKACEFKNSGACIFLGARYRFGLVVKQDYRKAKEYHEKACELKDGKGCRALGYMYSHGEGVKQDYSQAKEYYEKAKEYYEKACELKDGDGCEVLGYMYSFGQGVKQDYSQAKEYFEKAKEYYEKACDLKNGGGCSRLGYLYAQGQEVKQDYRKAKEYYEKACVLKDGEGCSALGILYVQGQVVKHDTSQAIEYWEKACELNGRRCFALGLEYARGRSVKQDYRKAKEYFEKVCEVEDVVGCIRLGYLYAQGQGVKQDYRKAKEYYEKACELKVREGCTNLGDLYAEGQGVKQDYRKAKEYFEKVCDSGSRSGCDAYKELKETY